MFLTGGFLRVITTGFLKTVDGLGLVESEITSGFTDSASVLISFSPVLFSWLKLKNKTFLCVILNYV